MPNFWQQQKKFAISKQCPLRQQTYCMCSIKIRHRKSGKKKINDRCKCHASATIIYAVLYYVSYWKANFLLSHYTGQSSNVNKFKIVEATQLSVLYAMTFPVTIQSSSSHKVLTTDIAMVRSESSVITFVDGEGWHLSEALSTLVTRVRTFTSMCSFVNT